MRVGVTQIRFIGEGSFFRASSGIFLKVAWALYSSEKGSTIAGDLQASEIAKTIILVVNGKADVTVLFQSDELSPAFREHPELAVMSKRLLILRKTFRSTLQTNRRSASGTGASTSLMGRTR